MATDVAIRNCYPILPCPFCNGNAALIGGALGGGFWVECEATSAALKTLERPPGCRFSGPCERFKVDAIDKWNCLCEAMKPIATPVPDVVDLVKSDIDTRKEFGLKQYGVPLKPFNGKKSLQECYEELLDAAFYLRQEIYERYGK